MINKELITIVFEKLLKCYGRQYWWPAKSTDEIIIGALLTQNTNWNNVIKAINNLKGSDLCSLNALQSADVETIAQLIKPSGYYNVKAGRLKELCEAINNTDLANMKLNEARRWLLNIKGVGNETADSILLYAFNKPVFVIDAYTQRLFSRLLNQKKVLRYNELQSLFHNNLPADVTLFNEYHALLVNHAKHKCKKTQPFCRECCIKLDCSYYLEGISETNNYTD